jgi:hypothetical protein
MDSRMLFQLDDKTFDRPVWLAVWGSWMYMDETIDGVLEKIYDGWCDDKYLCG